MANKLFKKLIGKNIKVYVNDMIANSVKTADHVADLRKAFIVLRENGMKLNPEKCVFRVKSRKYLVFMVS